MSEVGAGIGRRSSEISGPRRERQKLKRQQQNGEAPAMDLSRPAMMEQSNTDSWQLGWAPDSPGAFRVSHVEVS